MVLVTLKGPLSRCLLWVLGCCLSSVVLAQTGSIAPAATPSASRPAAKPGSKTTKPPKPMPKEVAGAKNAKAVIPVMEDEMASVKIKDGQLTLSGRPASAGDRVRKGDILVTDASSGAVLQFSDGSTLAMRSETRLKINELSINPATRGARRDFGLSEGRVEADIVPSNGERKNDVKVRTPRIVLSVRGTQFRVEAQANGNAIAEVVSGLVSVSRLHAPLQTFANLEPGQAMLAAGQKQSLQEMPLPPPRPELEGEMAPGGWLYFPQRTGVAAYRLIISGTHVLQIFRSVSVMPGSAWQIPDLPVGDYVLDVRSVTTAGVEGRPANLNMTVLPSSPKGLRISRSENGLEISWAPVIQASHYIVEIFSLRDRADESVGRYEISGFEKLNFNDGQGNRGLFRVHVTAASGDRLGKAATTMGPAP